MKTWNIGNTTVRNPSRVRDGLAVLARDFRGVEWTPQAEVAFFEALVAEGVYRLSGAPIASTSAGQSGRKWASVFNQLGFARVWRRTGAVELTAVGEALLAAQGEDEISEVFLRQLLKYHLPSPIEGDGKFDGFDVSPFWLFLRLMVQLKEAGEPGLTKEEIGLFLVTTIVEDDDSGILERIRVYRTERGSLVGRVARDRYDSVRRRQTVEALYVEEARAKYEALDQAVRVAKAGTTGIESNEVAQLLDQVVASGKGSQTQRAARLRAALKDGLKDGESLAELWDTASVTWTTTRGRSLFDYADTAVRYFSMTGLFSIAGSRVVLRESAQPLAAQLLTQGPSEYNTDHYLEEFYDPSLPILPSDDIAFLVTQYDSVRQALGVVADDTDISKARQLKRRLTELRAQLAELQEMEFYRRQPECIEDIDRYFEEIADRSLLGGKAYLPAFYEWNIWRCFLAVNEITSPIPKTRGFKIDDEMYPVHHAAGGQPDMVFHYQHGILVVEATLSVGENQWSQEQEPVQRHVKSVMLANPNECVIGIFIAPRIDMNTALNFCRAMGWFGDQGERRLNIVPISTEQLRTLMHRFEDEGFASEQMFNLFLSALAARDEGDSVAEWLVRIDEIVRSAAFV